MNYPPPGQSAWLGTRTVQKYPGVAGLRAPQNAQRHSNYSSRHRHARRDFAPIQCQAGEYSRLASESSRRQPDWRKGSSEISRRFPVGKGPLYPSSKANPRQTCPSTWQRRRAWARSLRQDRDSQFRILHTASLLNELFSAQPYARITNPQPHFESAQDRQVMHPSIMITAAVLHLLQSCAPSGYSPSANASCCLRASSYSARFASMSRC